jgi:ribosomal protein S18 acetylase RimI-like enzyme
MDALPEIYADDMVKAGEYRSLRSKVGWRTPERTDDEIQRALNITWNATARTQVDGRLVGLVRVLDDGLFYASVWDVIVAPPLQRRGIGRALLEMAMARTAARGFVVLVATSEGEGLYRAAGFTEADGGRKALFWLPEQHS